MAKAAYTMTPAADRRTALAPNRGARRRALHVLGAGALGSVGGVFLRARPAHAQSEDNYPSRAITMIVPFPPGGVAELVGRPVAAALERSLGQPVVVENRAGAGGGVGMGAAARARPDGYTVLFALSSIGILPAADKVLGRTPLYTLDSLVPVARFTADPVVWVVRADSPWSSWAEFVADARARPGSITYGSSGNYGTMHVPVEAMAQQAGLKLLHVPYTGAGPALVGLLGGQVEAAAAGPSAVAAQIKAGKLRALAGWGGERVQALPDVPTLTELGLPVRFSQWSGLFVPAGVPSAVLVRLGSAARAVTEDARFRESLARLQTPLQFMDAAQFKRFYEEDAQAMAQIVQRIGKVE
jgi:tripartite-type tricarboxylate transporter receptor subunit TctC